MGKRWKVSAEAIVRDRLGIDFRLERQRSNDGSVYYLVREWFNGEPAQMWTGCGDTPSLAWKDAAIRMRLVDEDGNPLPSEPNNE